MKNRIKKIKEYTRTVEFKIFISLFLVYMLFGQHVTPQEKGTLDASLAIGYQNRYTIDDYHDFHANTKTMDLAYYDGHFYSNKAFGLPLLGGIFTKVLHPVLGDDPALTQDWQSFYLLVFILIIFTSSLFTALTGVLIYRTCRLLTNKNKLSILIAFTYGLGPLVMENAIRYKPHAISTFFGFLCFYLILEQKYRTKFIPKMNFIAGLAVGFAVFCDYPSLIVAAMCGLLLILYREYKMIKYYVVGVLIIFFMHATCTYLIYDNLLTMSYNHLYKDFYHPDDNVLVGIVSFDYIFHNIFQTLFMPFRGLFIYSTIFLFSVPGLYMMRKKYPNEALIISIICIVVLIWNATRWTWWCNSGLQCRRFLIFLPFLTLAVAIFLKKMKLRYILPISIWMILNGLLVLQRPDRIGGIMYGYNTSLVKFSVLSYYHLIASPLLDYYFPLFLRFGPLSHVINKIIGFQIPVFVNLFAVICIIIFIWYKSIWKITKKYRAISLIIGILLISLISMRILYNEEVLDYSEYKYTQYNLEKEPTLLAYKYNWFNKYFLPEPSLVEHFTENLYFNIPFILEVPKDIKVLNQLNKNWYYPHSPPFNPRYFNYMYQDATIVLFSEQQAKKNITLDVASYYKTKTLEIFLNNKIIDKRQLNESGDTISLEINLDKGENSLLFHSVEGCTFQSDKVIGSPIYELEYMRNLQCRSFRFYRIEIK